LIFVDASAMVAVIAGEPDARLLGAKMQSGEPLLCSAISVWETAAALCKSYRHSPATARKMVAEFIMLVDIEFVSVGEQEAGLAQAAYEKYGKGRHKAALNMGDCFAYACAKANGAKLLFKGGDFALTDVDAA
jgi:ribonuclease VapC